MGLFGVLLNEKRRHKSVKNEQEYLDMLIKKSMLLFEEKDDYYDKDDYYHYFSMQYFLTPQNNLISQKTTGYQDGHNVMYSSSLVFRQFISFAELNEIIEKSDSAEAKSFRGIAEDNCRQYVLSKIKRELVKKEKNRLRKIYPNNNDWCAPKNKFDYMKNIGCARVMLDNYTDKLADMSYKRIKKLYIKSGLNHR